MVRAADAADTEISISGAVVKKRGALYLVLAVCGLIAASAKAQSDHELVLALRSDVVAIEAEWPDGTIKEGFGFVVGQRDRTAYVATAAHVLRGSGPNDQAESIKVRLFDLPRFQSRDAEFLVTASEIDLGVISFDWPSDIPWKTSALAPADRKISFGDPVWFIGRDRDWYVPSSPGSVNRVSAFSRRINLDNLPVRVGTSGAPLLGRDGIIGMVIRDSSADEAIAVPISAIRLAFEEWNLPWGLVESGSFLNGPPVAGEVFNDCKDEGWCPEMVVVPAGSFLMGSPPDEEERDDDEGPQHRVTIAQPFAIGVYEVTRGQFATFVEATGHDAGDSCYAYDGEWQLVEGQNWRSPGFSQSGDHPVVCVSWDDAQAYVDWLSNRTGEAYRLPSEAEWEYAARAGTTTRYWPGDEITPEYANSGRNVGRTIEVGSLGRPNSFGLHDVHGNVWEWVEDCWNESYAGAPANGTAWTSGECGRRVLRGGSWYNYPRILRSAFRVSFSTDNRLIDFGFRVARTLR